MVFFLYLAPTLGAWFGIAYSYSIVKALRLG